MSAVFVRIYHRDRGPGSGPLERLLAEARRLVAERQLATFDAAGASDVRLLPVAGDATSFGSLLDDTIDQLRGTGRGDPGLVVLGSGSIPLATKPDLAQLVAAAADPAGPALTNNRFSGDVVAIPRATDLPAVPALPGDNALPRWLEERAGRSVADRREVWRLQVDIDGPLDVVLLEGRGRALAGLTSLAPDLRMPLANRLATVRPVFRDRRAEVLVAGRTSARALSWLERNTASRTRAIVEERGLRASTCLALGDAEGRAGRARPLRPPCSVLGSLLDRDGPEALGRRLAEVADAALVDTRVLLAHRLGVDESKWPPPEDRFASDLLLPDRIGDPWLRSLTRSALDAAIPVLLGGHSLVGPGLRLVVAAPGAGR